MSNSRLNLNMLRAFSLSEAGFGRLRMAVIALLLVWVLYLLSQLVWLLLTPAPDTTESLPLPEFVDTQGRSNTQLDIARVAGYELFGTLGKHAESNKPLAPVVDEAELNAVKTKLNLKLQGIVYSPDQSIAEAIIAHQNKQASYRVGDKLPVGNRVELSKVLLDRVIIVNNGRYEAVFLYDENDKTISSVSAKSQVDRSNTKPSRENRAQAAKLARNYRQRLYKNPESLAEVIQIAPYQQDGQLKGYRISPGRDRDQFATLGFKANDIVTSVNSLSLDNPSNIREAYNLMRNEKTASFMVLRDGSEQLVEVELGANQAEEH